MQVIVPVKLKEKSYQIIIGPNALGELKKTTDHYFPNQKIFILTNTKLKNLYQTKIDQILRKNTDYHWITIPDGEKYKTLQTVEKIYHQMIKKGANRKSGLIAFGGGVVGDIGGFVSATYMRGIDYIQVPTSLLSQVDSSVGGKTGVDLSYGKNLVGAFYQPKKVIIDTHLLNTLPHRELKCGLSEVVKYGALWDKKLFKYLEENHQKILDLDQKILTQVIAKCCAIKALIVSKDEKESSIRALLNFGHTLGHAIELLCGFSKYKHGEAVSQGMVYAAKLSQSLNLCSENDVVRLKNLLTQFKLPTQFPKYPKKSYEKAILRDKKVSGKKIKFIVLNQIGKTSIKELSTNEILKLA